MSASPVAPSAGMISEGDYWQRLTVHDWHYTMSDSYEAWLMGNTEEKELRVLSRLSPRLEGLWLAFAQYHLGEGAELPPKPHVAGESGEVAA